MSLRSTKSQCAQCVRLTTPSSLAASGLEVTVCVPFCRFAPRSRFAPEQCVPFCRFAPRSTLLNSVCHLVFCRFAPEERVCRFAPRSRFAPERPSQSCAPSGRVHSLKSQCAQCRFAPEERVCRFAPRSRFAPEQCLSFCRFAPRSRLQRQRGRDSVRIISLRSRLDPAREGRACCGAKCCSQHAPRRTRSLRSARGRLSLEALRSSFFPSNTQTEPVWSVSI